MTFGYAYNPAGEIVSNTRSNDAYSFTLANANVASSPDGLNRLASIAGSSIGYDDRGNATSVPAAGSVTGTARNFEYNADNALVVATDSSGGRQEMMPDSLERLHRYYDGSANRWLLYDGHRLIAETNSSATAIARRYVHGPGTDEPLVWYEGSGTGDRRWLHADERGSVIAASDGSGDLVGSINRYDDYGTPQGGGLTGRFGYTGQAWLPQPGLYDYRARFYNPALGGRFMQTDPIGYGGGMNLYAYVGNNPVNFTDPWGLDCPDPNTCVTVTGNPPRPQNPPTTRTFFSMGHTHVVNLTEREFFSRVEGREPDCDEPDDAENCVVVNGEWPPRPVAPPPLEDFYPPTALDFLVMAQSNSCLIAYGRCEQDAIRVYDRGDATRAYRMRQQCNWHLASCNTVSVLSKIPGTNVFGIIIWPNLDRVLTVPGRPDRFVPTARPRR